MYIVYISRLFLTNKKPFVAKFRKKVLSRNNKDTSNRHKTGGYKNVCHAIIIKIKVTVKKMKKKRGVRD